MGEYVGFRKLIKSNLFPPHPYTHNALVCQTVAHSVMTYMYMYCNKVNGNLSCVQNMAIIKHAVHVQCTGRSEKIIIIVFATKCTYTMYLV